MSSTTECMGQCPATVPQQRRRWQGKLHRVCRKLKCWRERTRQRRLLAGLSDRELKDIAVSRVDALREADKPFWRG